MAIYDINGNPVDAGGTASDVTSFVKSVSHRGTTFDGKLRGYINAKTAGFDCGENDLQFTSDGRVIMRHDATINGATINTLTYAEIMQIDSDIPTLEQWLECMKCIALHPYIDTKYTSATWSLDNLQIAVDIVKSFGFSDKCTWLVGRFTEFDTILQSIPNARIGLLGLPTSSNITNMLSRRTDENDLFFDSSYESLTEEHISACISNNIPLEVYTVASAQAFETAYAISNYISGFTCNGTVVPSKILKAKYM